MTDDNPDGDDEGPDPGSMPIAIDANVLDRTGSRGMLVAEFMALAAAGRITVRIGGGVEAELAEAERAGAFGDSPRPSVVPPVRPPRPLSSAQHLSRIRVRAIICGNAAPGRHDADAAHLSEAAEAGCGYFVTYDSRILRKRNDLQAFAIPGLRIVTLEAFLDIVRRFERRSGPRPGPPDDGTGS